MLWYFLLLLLLYNIAHIKCSRFICAEDVYIRRDSWTNRSIVLNCFEGEKLTEKIHFCSQIKQETQENYCYKFHFFFLRSVPRFKLHSQRREKICVKKWTIKLFPFSPNFSSFFNFIRCWANIEHGQLRAFWFFFGEGN